MLSVLKTIFGQKEASLAPGPVLRITRVASYEAYCAHALRSQEDHTRRYRQERNLIQNTSSFTVPGYCFVCARHTNFLVDFNYAPQENGERVPNWRERLECPHCKLNNRLRASVQIFEQECQPKPTDKIYITEQVTSLYKILRRKYAGVVGSEYLGEFIAFGRTNWKRIRNEDLTQLSFKDNEFDLILSFDVFEHIPSYQKGLRECLRCLQPGGKLLFSVPFVKESPENIVRARLNSDKTVTHILPPEYHGNPLGEGCLCFHHFGWALLDEIRNLGFGDVNALLYWSRELGYMGSDQILFEARKVTT